jgi:aminopeptidase-like protein
MGGQQATDAVMAMLWVLAYSDGGTSLLDIAGVAGTDFAALRAAAATLEGAGLLARRD